MQTLQEAIRKNRERKVRLLEQQADKATRRASYFRNEARKIKANPTAWLDPQGEVDFMLACAKPFDQTATDCQRQIAAIKETL